MIRYGQQDITQADIDAVVAVLRSTNLTQGPTIPAFEQAVIEVTGARHAVAVNSATSALHIACLALDLGPGDWLWTTPNIRRSRSRQRRATRALAANAAGQLQLDQAGEELDMIQPLGGAPRADARRLSALAADAAGGGPASHIPVRQGRQLQRLEIEEDQVTVRGTVAPTKASRIFGASVIPPYPFSLRHMR